MARSTATYILVAVLAIPAVTLVVLIILAQAIRNWWELILPVFGVYLIAFMASVLVRKACDKKIGKWRKAIGFLLLKTILFTFGIVGTICAIVSGGGTLVVFQMPNITINLTYLIVLVIAWIVMTYVNEVTIK